MSSSVLVRAPGTSSDAPEQISGTPVSLKIQDLEREVEDQFKKLGLDDEEEIDYDDPEYQETYLGILSKMADKKTSTLRLKRQLETERDIQRERERSLIVKIDKARETVIDKFGDLVQTYFDIDLESLKQMSDKEIVVLADMLMKQHRSFWGWRNMWWGLVIWHPMVSLLGILAYFASLGPGLSAVNIYNGASMAVYMVFSLFMFFKLIKINDSGWRDFCRSLSFLRKNLGRHHFPIQEFQKYIGQKNQ